MHSTRLPLACDNLRHPIAIYVGYIHGADIIVGNIDGRIFNGPADVDEVRGELAARRKKTHDRVKKASPKGNG